MELLCRDIVYAAKEKGGDGGRRRRRELGDRNVHMVEGRMDGTWAARAEKGATETWLPWMVGIGGCGGLGGLGHLGP